MGGLGAGQGHPGLPSCLEHRSREIHLQGMGDGDRDAACKGPADGLPRSAGQRGLSPDSLQTPPRRSKVHVGGCRGRSICGTLFLQEQGVGDPGPGSPQRVPSQPSPPVLLSLCQEAVLSDSVLAPSYAATLASMHLKYLKQCAARFVNLSGFFLKQYHLRGKHPFCEGWRME